MALSLYKTTLWNYCVSPLSRSVICTYWDMDNDHHQPFVSLILPYQTLYSIISCHSRYTYTFAKVHASWPLQCQCKRNFQHHKEIRSHECSLRLHSSMWGMVLFLCPESIRGQITSYDVSVLVKSIPSSTCKTRMMRDMQASPTDTNLIGMYTCSGAGCKF